MFNQEKTDERVTFLVTRSQKEFLDKNVEKGSLGEFLRWLLDNHIHSVRKEG